MEDVEQFWTLDRLVARTGAARRGQAGVSLLEVLVGIAVMVPLTLASVMGLQLEMKTSASTQRRQQLEVALTTATEDLKTLPYLPCGTPADYQKVYGSWSQSLGPQLREEERPPEPTIVSVDYWHHGKQAFTNSCSGDDGAQRLVVKVAADDIQATGSVVKRDEFARVGNSG